MPRCVVYFYRNVVLNAVPRGTRGKSKGVARTLKAIHAQETKADALERVRKVAKKLGSLETFEGCRGRFRGDGRNDVAL